MKDLTHMKILTTAKFFPEDKKNLLYEWKIKYLGKCGKQLCYLPPLQYVII